MPRKPKVAPVENPYAGLSTDNENSFVQDLLDDAKALQDEKKALLERVGANRDTLRTVAKTGRLSEVQAKAITLFYPEREKKADDTTAPTNPEAPASTTPAAA